MFSAVATLSHPDASGMYPCRRPLASLRAVQRRFVWWRRLSRPKQYADHDQQPSQGKLRARTAVTFSALVAPPGAVNSAPSNARVAPAPWLAWWHRSRRSAYPLAPPSTRRPPPHAPSRKRRWRRGRRSRRGRPPLSGNVTEAQHQHHGDGGPMLTPMISRGRRTLVPATLRRGWQAWGLRRPGARAAPFQDFAFDGCTEPFYLAQAAFPRGGFCLKN